MKGLLRSVTFPRNAERRKAFSCAFPASVSKPSVASITGKLHQRTDFRNSRCEKTSWTETHLVIPRVGTLRVEVSHALPQCLENLIKVFVVTVEEHRNTVWCFQLLNWIVRRSICSKAKLCERRIIVGPYSHVAGMLFQHLARVKEEDLETVVGWKDVVKGIEKGEVGPDVEAFAGSNCHPKPESFTSVRGKDECGWSSVLINRCRNDICSSSYLCE